MKSIFNILSAFFVSVLATTTLLAQDCVICNDSRHSTFVGYNYSNNYSLGYYSYNLGWEINGSYGSSIIIGSGVSPLKQLSNPNGGIAFGMNSMVPTMRITASANDNKTGMVAIGNITNPLEKLHILSDNQENAGIFLQTSNDDKSTFIKFNNDNQYISVRNGQMDIQTGGQMNITAKGLMNLNSEGNALGITSGNANLTGNLFTLGSMKSKKLSFDANDFPIILSNATRVGSTFYRNQQGSSYAIEFKNDALRIRTAVNQDPRGTEITNWKDALFLTTNGKVGIGSTETFLMNKGDEQLLVVSPKKMVFQTGIVDIEANDLVQIKSQMISLGRRVGINTPYVPDDFAVAVNGGIISTRVHVRDLGEWPDFVFAEGYGLMPLNELKQYVDKNKHLPEVPSETEVSANGIDLGELQSILLKKIEELTLYTIQLQEQGQRQQELIEQLQNEIQALKAK